MFRIAITAMTVIAAVTAIHGTEANTVTATEIGYPPYVNRKCEDAIGIKCLKAWQDRIYIGYGSWSPNRGPVSINYYSPADDKFVTETVYVDGETQKEIFLLEDSIDRYIVIGGELYLTGTDPMPNPNETPADSWLLGNFYRNDGSGWKKYRTIPHGVHNFDMIKKDGDLFAAIGIGTEGVPLLRSSDGGLTWVNAVGSSSIKRFNQLFRLNGTLYAIASRGDPGKVYKYDSSTQLFTETSWNLMPDDPKAVAVTSKIGGRIYYIAKGNNKWYTALQEEDGVLLPTIPLGGKIYDLKKVDNVLYVLITLENENNFTVLIQTLEGVLYKGGVMTHLPSNAISMEVFDGKIYLGTESGIIYSIPDSTP